jgi:hypothetical protein
MDKKSPDLTHYHQVILLTDRFAFSGLAKGITRSFILFKSIIGSINFILETSIIYKNTEALLIETST